MVKLNQFKTLLPNKSSLTGLKLGVAKGRLKFLHSILSLKPLYKTDYQAKVKTHVQRRVKMRRDFIIVLFIYYIYELPAQYIVTQAAIQN